MAYEPIDDPYRTPQNHIGERPYEGPIGAVRKLLDKIGQRRLAGISGAIMAPTGPGVSDFQAGFGGFQGGVQGYDKKILEMMRLAQQQNLAERTVEAREKTAAASENRASTYRTWVNNRSTSTPGAVNSKQAMLDWAKKLPPEDLAFAQKYGILPREPVGSKPDNEDQMVKSLMDQYGMTEPHARLIASVRPGLIGTVDKFTENKKTGEINRVAQRQFGIGKKAKGILAIYGLTPEDLWGIQDQTDFVPPEGYGNPTEGDNAASGGDENIPPDAFDDMGTDELESVLLDHENGDLELSEGEIQLIMDRLQKLREAEAYGGPDRWSQ